MHAGSFPELVRIVDRRYELGERLGRGRYADVFAAVHLLTQREHALKLWRLALDRPEDAARWKREILAPTQISHASIVPITDAGVDAMQRPYVVMDRLRGEDLSKRLERGPLSLDEVLEVFELLIDGLAAAHSAGIVHRDLKPANVFIERDDHERLRVRLLDFGYALPVAQGLTRITGEGVSLGTVCYMAPEQAIASEYVGRAADVWAVGVILYQCFTGRCPFEADDIPPLIRAICRGDFVPAARLATHVPPIIDAIIGRCLCVSPEKRYADAGVLRQAWSAVRATRVSWDHVTSLDPEEAPTRALWSGTGVPLPAYARVASGPPPAAPVTTGPSTIPVTRASAPTAAASAADEPDSATFPVTRTSQPTAPTNAARESDSTMFPVAADYSGSCPEPSDYASTIRLRPAEPPAAARISSSPPPFIHPAVPVVPSTDLVDSSAGARASRGVLLALVLLAIVLAACAALVFVGRDTLIVPLLSGRPDDVGHLIVHRTWTPVVNAASCLLATLAGLAGLGAALHSIRARARR